MFQEEQVVLLEMHPPECHCPSVLNGWHKPATGIASPWVPDPKTFRCSQISLLVGLGCPYLGNEQYYYHLLSSMIIYDHLLSITHMFSGYVYIYIYACVMGSIYPQQDCFPYVLEQLETTLWLHVRRIQSVFRTAPVTGTARAVDWSLHSLVQDLMEVI